MVLHEYGHGIDHWRGGILDGGYSEGLGDAVALLVTRQPCLGRDFRGAGTCLRSATDVDLWPPAPNEGVHAIGKRYGQFTWQLVQELKKTSSEDQAYAIASRLTLAAAAGNPSNIPDAVRLVFLADDTDTNVGNGTPHCKAIAAAADSRKIPKPAGLRCVGPPRPSRCPPKGLCNKACRLCLNPETGGPWCDICDRCADCELNLRGLKPGSESLTEEERK